jgi:hypothetical protein
VDEVVDALDQAAQHVLPEVRLVASFGSDTDLGVEVGGNDGLSLLASAIV